MKHHICPGIDASGINCDIPVLVCRRRFTFLGSFFLHVCANSLVDGHFCDRRCVVFFDPCCAFAGLHLNLGMGPAQQGCACRFERASGTPGCLASIIEPGCACLQFKLPVCMYLSERFLIGGGYLLLCCWPSLSRLCRSCSQESAARVWSTRLRSSEPRPSNETCLVSTRSFLLMLQVLFNQGDESDFAYFIIGGTLSGLHSTGFSIP